MLDKPNQTMSMQNVRKVVAFLKRSKYPIFRMMGGEPTLHPQFQEITKLALEEGMRVDLLSNATWNAIHNEWFGRISPHRLLFLLNIDHPNNYHPNVWGKIKDNLDALAGRKGVSLSFNIFEKEPKSDYIFDLTTKYDISTVRLSFSLPTLGTENAHLGIEDYEEMAPFIMDFVRKAEAGGVSVQLDNAIPLCIFTNDQAGELLLKGVLDFKRNARCEPIVDIGPDLTIWYCFCLSGILNRRLDEFETLQEINEYYRRVMSSYQNRRFPMEKCYNCRYVSLWGCQGGCIAFSIDENKDLEADDLKIDPRENLQQEHALLAFAEDVTVSRYEIPEESYVLRNPESGTQIELEASFECLLNLLDGGHTPREVVERFLDNADYNWGQNPVDDFSREVMEEKLNDLLLELVDRGFLVLGFPETPLVE
jgi:radical SAM protein with 4Fe4S-binding SPASM domain